MAAWFSESGNYGIARRRKHIRSPERTSTQNRIVIVGAKDEYKITHGGAKWLGSRCIHMIFRQPSTAPYRRVVTESITTQQHQHRPCSAPKAHVPFDYAVAGYQVEPNSKQRRGCPATTSRLAHAHAILAVAASTQEHRRPFLSCGKAQSPNRRNTPLAAFCRPA